MKELIPTECHINFADTHASIVFKTNDSTFLKENSANNADTLFEYNAEFYACVDASKCRFTIGKYKLEVSLVKKTPLTKWPSVLKPKPKLDEQHKVSHMKPLDKEQEDNAILEQTTDNFQKTRFTVNKSRVSTSPSSSPSPPPPTTTQSQLKQTSMKNSPPYTDSSQAGKKKLACENTNYGQVGLVNLGNTCYMNAAIQFLINATDLRDYFIGNFQRWQ